MNVRGLVSSLCLCLTVSSLAACNALRQAQDDMQPPIISPGAMPGALQPASSYFVLHRFSLRGRAKAGHPLAGLVNVGGTLYGTTWGTIRRHDAESSTVFSITTAGAYKNLYRFNVNGSDGFRPYATLLDVNGTLYGTTEYGGASGWGVVFSITTGGVEKTLYSFKGGSDGAVPFAGLTDVNGTLYGTTNQGGGTGCSYTMSQRYGCGTVYTISASGSEQVLYRFSGPDGANPGNAPLLDVNGTLYGTTEAGGSSGPSGAGTVFAITTSGSEHVLHSFPENSTDGWAPFAPLIDVNGKLYGTTAWGGLSGNGNGTVFEITPSGSEKVLYRFAAGADGAHPDSGLIYQNGALYGTTAWGGSTITCDYPYPGCGTIYRVTPRGSEKVLYRFKARRDGASPHGPFVSINGTFYSTAFNGGGSGCGRNGCGTVFTFSP